MPNSRAWWGRGKQYAAARLPRLLGPRRRHTELHAQEAYDRWAATYGEDPNALQRLEAEALEPLMPPLHRKRFLDLGCGKGRLSHLALQSGAARSVAVDFSAAMLTAPAAVRSPLLHRVRADASCLPFLSGSFDAVGAALIFGHMPDLKAALWQAHRVLRPGGWLLLSDFHPAATRRGWERTFTDPATGRTFAIRQHVHALAKYREILSALGFVIEKIEERDFERQPVIFVLRARV